MTAPLRFATFLAPNMVPVYRLLADRIGRRLGRRVELVVGRSFDQFERGEADLGVICGLPYVWLAARRPPPVEPLAAPVLSGARYAGRPVYYSDVIVRHDSPVSCLEELRGRSWAFNEPASHSGHAVTLYSLVALGARPGFLGPVVEAGFHQRAIRLVASGSVDAAAIDSQVLAIELRDHPRLVDLADDPAARPVLDHGVVERFTPVGDAAYDDIRAMLATIEAAGWTSLTQAAASRRRHKRYRGPTGSMDKEASEGSRPWRSRTSSPRRGTP